MRTLFNIHVKEHNCGELIVLTSLYILKKTTYMIVSLLGKCSSIVSITSQLPDRLALYITHGRLKVSFVIQGIQARKQSKSDSLPY